MRDRGPPGADMSKRARAQNAPWKLARRGSPQRTFGFNPYDPMLRVGSAASHFRPKGIRLCSFNKRSDQAFARSHRLYGVPRAPTLVERKPFAMIRVQSPDCVETRLRDQRHDLVTDCQKETSGGFKHMVADASSGGGRLHNLFRYGAGLTRPALMLRRLLAVVDATERSRRVLDYVIGYAASIGPVEAVVLNVQTDLNADPNAPLGTTDWPSGKRIIKNATRRLDRLGIVHKSRVEAGDPAATIARCTREERCDMIILSDGQTEGVLKEPSQARNGREESLSEEVSKLTSVPVVVAS